MAQGLPGNQGQSRWEHSPVFAWLPLVQVIDSPRGLPWGSWPRTLKSQEGRAPRLPPITTGAGPNSPSWPPWDPRPTQEQLVSGRGLPAHVPPATRVPPSPSWG